VIPTLGRATLGALLESLGGNTMAPGAVFVAADARAPMEVRAESIPSDLRTRVGVVRAAEPGPAAARNAGWRAARSEWVVFLDDDVVVPLGWGRALQGDIAVCGAGVAGSQGRVEVPLPRHRHPTDWERNVKGLESARHATADMAYRRAVLDEIGGFDERFVRAYREDSDCALRIQRAGYVIVSGSRCVTHPVGPTTFWSSVSRQAGNADDVLMRRLHGRRWRDAAGASRGRLARHVAVTGAAALGLLARGAGWSRTSGAALAAWAAGTAELAWRRVAPGPRDPREVMTMVVTSALIPPAATWHWLRGWLRAAPVARNQPGHEAMSRAREAGA
jgi:glycosyltransferase involved in cell wall biosynthesis